MTKFFIDTTDPVEIRNWTATGIVDGVTTNPLLMRKTDSKDNKSMLKEIAEIVGAKPISVQPQVKTHDQIVEECQRLAQIARNVVIKVAIIDENGNSNLALINKLAKMNIAVNATCCTSFGQGILAAKSGARYVSILYRRMLDAGVDADQVVRDLSTAIRGSGMDAEVLVASIRDINDVQHAIRAGADIVTIPTKILEKMSYHEYSMKMVHEFQEAYKDLAVR